MSNLTSHFWTNVQIISSKGRESYQSQSGFAVLFVTFIVLISSKIGWSLVKFIVSMKLLGIDYFYTLKSLISTLKSLIGYFHFNKFVKSRKLWWMLWDITTLWVVQFWVLQGSKLSFAEKFWVKWRYWSFNFSQWRWRCRLICCIRLGWD